MTESLSSSIKTDSRAALVQRGLRLSYFTIAYNTLEAIVSIASGLVSGSIALIGFGIDSAIEVTSSGVSQWRLRRDWDESRRQRVEMVSHRIIGWTFLALALYVAVDGIQSLVTREEPEKSLPGIAILVTSVIVMPVLAKAKRRVASSMNSGALRADAKQTSLCAYLSLIALTGVALNAAFGLWWADPVAALAMVPIIAKEGAEGAMA